MAHIFLQEDPKVSAGNADDNPTTIPIPEQLGSLLVTSNGDGTNGKIYAALPSSIAPNPQWVLVGFGSGIVGAGQKYWVNPAGKSPDTLYHTIQAGIDAANADWIAEGRTGSRDVFVLPGDSYTESPILKAGVNLIGLQSAPTATGVIVLGNMTTDVTEDITAVIRGFSVIGTFTALGAQVLSLTFEECLISGTNGFLDSNSNPASSYRFADCPNISATDPGGFSISMGATGFIVCERSQIGVLPNGQALFSSSTFAVFRDCQFIGSKTIASTDFGTARATFDRCDFTTDTAISFILSGGPEITITDSTEKAGTEPVFSGVGNIQRRGVNVYENASLREPGVTESGPGATIVYQTTKFSGAGPFTQNALARVYVILTDAGVQNFNLLSLLNFPDNVPVTIKNRADSAGTLLLQPDVGDSIDGLPTLPVATFVTLLSDRADRTWYIIGL